MPTTPNLALPYPALTDTSDVPRDLAALANALDNGAVPVGALMMWLLAAAPSGWLLCQGQTNIAIASYPKLAALLGNTGGFINMPDLRGRMPVGVGTAQGDATATAKTLGQKAGAEKLALTTAQLPAHTHVASSGTAAPVVRGQNAGGNPPGGVGAAVIGASSVGTGGSTYSISVNSQGSFFWTMYAESHSHTIAVNPTGSDQAHDNMPPFTCLNFIIRAL